MGMALDSLKQPGNLQKSRISVWAFSHFDFQKKRPMQNLLKSIGILDFPFHLISSSPEFDTPLRKAFTIFSVTYLTSRNESPPRADANVPYLRERRFSKTMAKRKSRKISTASWHDKNLAFHPPKLYIRGTRYTITHPTGNLHIIVTGGISFRPAELPSWGQKIVFFWWSKNSPRPGLPMSCIRIRVATTGESLAESGCVQSWSWWLYTVYLCCSKKVKEHVEWKYESNN